jgi:hypothetical protein
MMIWQPDKLHAIGIHTNNVDGAFDAADLIQ